MLTEEGWGRSHIVMMAKPLPVTQSKEKINRGKEAAIIAVLGRTDGGGGGGI